LQSDDLWFKPFPFIDSQNIAPRVAQCGISVLCSPLCFGGYLFFNSGKL
jgi:hypothetical protein